MIKNILLTLILVLAFCPIALAKDIPVKVIPLCKISTSDINLKEGDRVKFINEQDVYINKKVYIKSGALVTGVITSLVPNGFTCQEASIYSENFKVKNTEGNYINLKGIIYKKGHSHAMATQFFIIPIFYIVTRGGEVQILPEKDTFTLYVEGNND